MDMNMTSLITLQLSLIADKDNYIKYLETELLAMESHARCQNCGRIFYLEDGCGVSEGRDDHGDYFVDKGTEYCSELCAKRAVKEWNDDEDFKRDLMNVR